MAAKKRKKATKVGKRTPGAGEPAAKRAMKQRAQVPPAAAASRKKAPARRPAEPAASVEPKPSQPSRPAAKEAAQKKVAAKKVAAKKVAAAKPGAAEGGTSSLTEGARAPSFELQDQHGNSVSSRELAGHPYVLYFYPKDDTPGCTTQACGFRDALPEFEGVGVRVLGVSPDSVSSHQRFVTKYGLPFTLLSDVGQSLASAYGVWSLKKNYGREYMGVVRSTFLVDGENVVRKIWRNVRVNGHIPEVQAAAEKLA
jgi:thioredoxin-dependent peroxiredoxin